MTINPWHKKRKKSPRNSVTAVLQGREMVFNASRSGIFSMPPKKLIK